MHGDAFGRGVPRGALRLDARREARALRLHAAGHGPDELGPGCAPLLPAVRRARGAAAAPLPPGCCRPAGAEFQGRKACPSTRPSAAATVQGAARGGRFHGRGHERGCGGGHGRAVAPGLLRGRRGRPLRAAREDVCEGPRPRRRIWGLPELSVLDLPGHRVPPDGDLLATIRPAPGRCCWQGGQGAVAGAAHAGVAAAVLHVCRALRRWTSPHLGEQWAGQSDVLDDMERESHRTPKCGAPDQVWRQRGSMPCPERLGRDGRMLRAGAGEAACRAERLRRAG
mmetsp:Transcript_96754/g.273651  ORF Transcript_96754/g.273651 Transcript_96754/m.273651 type:complete len:283 (+) Transcript_96754:612-1460(+)